ncbi:MAG: AraC family transcriptional regulator [Halieaceae bacterium]|nr:AraC family transcriptional regulator [Halieaceae bacterium]
MTDLHTHGAAAPLPDTDATGSARLRARLARTAATIPCSSAPDGATRDLRRPGVEPSTRRGSALAAPPAAAHARGPRPGPCPVTSGRTGDSSRAPAPPPGDSGGSARPSAAPCRDDEKPAYMPLSRTTDRVLEILLDGDLARLRAESVAERLGISCTTLRRRLRNDHTNYQFLLDRARQYRCESRLRERWLPGKCLADELGYLEVNSFYRAFRRWTGMSYSAYKQARYPLP